ncbi:hypothetical protein C8J48_1963 [Desmospora activa DSM 45169]|uniref:Competence protein ComGF n=1 Tax=Desmospora activa DSM 45169 TaxID=1121389 RepID=A0A2T4ZBR9_9BACL|nr:hypothetical protein C8J48_1963 [Desmospora activa DSM 45169]
MLLMLFLIPVVMAVTFHMETGVKETFWEQQLQMELSAFAMDVRDEIRACTDYRLTEDGSLLMDTADGATIRYKLDQHRIIRSVRPPGESRFQGTTILAYNVSQLMFSPDDVGLLLKIRLENGWTEREAQYYFRGRTEGANKG